MVVECDIDQVSDGWEDIVPTLTLAVCCGRCVPELESGTERAHHVQQIVVTLPRTIIIVMRYLFAFLNQ